MLKNWCSDKPSAQHGKSIDVELYFVDINENILTRISNTKIKILRCLDAEI